jgi:starvation-inducible outer membrane lipoprotein
LGGTPFRKNYATIGGTYDSTRDAFISVQPYNSWSLNETTCLWEAPIPYPDDGNLYEWDEETYQEDNTLGWLLKA